MQNLTKMSKHIIDALPVCISNTNPEDYLIKRIEKSHHNKASNNGPGGIDFINFSIEQSQKILERMKIQPKTSTLPSQGIPEKKLDLLNQYQASLSNTVSKLYPLLEGEELIEDRLLCTTERYEVIPVSSLVLKRKTNFSEILFIDFCAQLKFDSFDVERKSLSRGEEDMDFSMANNEIDYTAIARKLAEGLTGMAPSPWNKIASKLLQYAWPTQSDAQKDWEAAFKRINQIVKGALAKNRVDDAIKVLNGFISFMNTQYVHIRDNKAIPKKDKLNALAPYDHDFYTRIAEQLQETKNPALAISALANFMLGANLHIALIQEKGLQSEGEQIEAYKKTVVSLAKKYGGYASSMKQVMVNYRTGFISKIETDCNIKGSYYTIKDNFTGKEVAYCYFTKDTVMEALEYMRKKRSEIIGLLAAEQERSFDENILPIIQNWEKLKDNPIPIDK